VPKEPELSISDALPPQNERLVVPTGSSRARRDLRLAWKTSVPDSSVRLTISLKDSNGRQKQILDTVVRAKGNVAIFAGALKKPGQYLWSLSDVKNQKALYQSQFALAPEFEGIELNPPLVGGSEIKSNQSEAKLIKDFQGVTLGWKPFEDARKYRLTIFKDAQAQQPLLDKEVETDRFTFNRNKVYTGRVYYRVSAVLLSGFKVTSKVGTYEFVFLPPQLVLPLNGAEIGSNSGRVGAVGTILFTWKKTLFTDSYEIELAEDASFSKPVVKKKVKENFLAIPTPDTGSYYWRVRSLSQGSASPASAPHSLTVR
jgi:hypothetical protein